MAIKKMYKINNSPATVLTVKAESSDTEFTVDDISAFPEAPNLAVVTDVLRTEIILYSGIEGNKLTGVTRGVNGTVAQVWVIGTQIMRTYTSYDHDTFIDNIEDLEDRKVDSSELGPLAFNDEIDISTESSSFLKEEYGGTNKNGLLTSKINFRLPITDDSNGYNYTYGSALSMSQVKTNNVNTYRLKDVAGYLNKNFRYQKDWGNEIKTDHMRFLSVSINDIKSVRIRFKLYDRTGSSGTYFFGAFDYSGSIYKRYALKVTSRDIMLLLDGDEFFSFKTPLLEEGVAYDLYYNMSSLSTCETLMLDSKMYTTTYKSPKLTTFSNVDIDINGSSVSYSSGIWSHAPNFGIKYEMYKTYDGYGILTHDFVPGSDDTGDFLYDAVDGKKYTYKISG